MGIRESLGLMEMVCILNIVLGSVQVDEMSTEGVDWNFQGKSP